VDTTSVGSATYTAGETNDPPVFADDLTINAGVTVSVTGGDLNLRAGDEVIVNGTASASGLLTLIAGFGDVDNNGGLILNGTLNAGTGLGLQAINDIALNSAINLAGLPVSITSTAGAILDGNADTLNVVAASLGLWASTGIGVGAGGALETQVLNLEARTATGGIFVSNTGGDLTIGGVTPPLAPPGPLTGLRVETSGDINVVNAGSIFLADTTGSEIVRGGGTSGNVFLTAAPAPTWPRPSITTPSRRRAATSPSRRGGTSSSARRAPTSTTTCARTATSSSRPAATSPSTAPPTSPPTTSATPPAAT
jgi:hypothetical protein